MPKNLLTNSRPCACCHRLMPRKTGKRRACSKPCREITQIADRRKKRAWAPK